MFFFGRCHRLQPSTQLSRSVRRTGPKRSYVERGKGGRGAIVTLAESVLGPGWRERDEDDAVGAGVASEEGAVSTASASATKRSRGDPTA